MSDEQDPILDDDDGYYEQWDGNNEDPFAEDEEFFDLLNTIATAYGISSFQDIVVLIDELDSGRIEDLRAVRFASPEEAAVYLYGGGIFGISEIVDLGSGVYAVSIPAASS